MSGYFFDITLVAPSFEPDAPLTKYKVEKMTRTSLTNLMARSGMAGLVQVSKLPARGVPLAEVALEMPEHLELVDGGTYLVVNLASSVEQQVDALQGWQGSLVQADEVAAIKRAVTWLKEAGHPEAKMLCVNFLQGAGRKVEVDGVVVANGCAAIVEAKTKLTSESASSLVGKMATIRVMVESAEPSTVSPLGQLKGKQLLPVLCGRAVTSNTMDLNKMVDICWQHQIECWDMSGRVWS